MKLKFQVFLFTILLLAGCDPGTRTQHRVREYSVQSVLWQQHAAEYRALSYQAFNLAKWQLDNILESRNDTDKPFAVVTDIDETVLDNSPYDGKLIETDEEYSRAGWLEWGKKAAAAPVPGSVGFFQYAEKRGVEVFYISNRYAEQKDETISNLKMSGFPFADETHVLLREDESGKEARRNGVEETHEIVMLIGDNLSDFSEVFDDQPTAVRNHLADSLESEFGKNFIVLPNPMYGDWETNGILEDNAGWTPDQKDSVRHSKIITY